MWPKIMISRDSQQTDIPFTKEESTTITRSQDHDSNDHHLNAPNSFKSFSSSTASSSSSSWSRLKDPRIVRVSRAFGGKDRHSKVCTVRGLRDRRVRLSVPTAIQLYDLQDRLGLNQPSKVVDWLLEAAKHEIEELPPLQIPPGTFAAQISDQAKQSLNVFGEKLKEVSGENASTTAEFNSANSASSMTNLMNSTGYNIRWDPSSLTLSSSAAHHPPRPTAQIEDWHNFSLVPLQPTVSHLHHHHHHHHHQVLVYQPGMSSTTQSYFPQNNNSDQFDNPNKAVNFHDSTIVESTNAAGGAHHFNMSTTANLLPSHNNEGR